MKRRIAAVIRKSDTHSTFRHPFTQYHADQYRFNRGLEVTAQACIAGIESPAHKSSYARLEEACNSNVQCGLRSSNSRRWYAAAARHRRSRASRESSANCSMLAAASSTFLSSRQPVRLEASAHASSAHARLLQEAGWSPGVANMTMEISGNCASAAIHAEPASTRSPWKECRRRLGTITLDDERDIFGRRRAPHQTSRPEPMFQIMRDSPNAMVIEFDKTDEGREEAIKTGRHLGYRPSKTSARVESRKPFCVLSSLRYRSNGTTRRARLLSAARCPHSPGR